MSPGSDCLHGWWMMLLIMMLCRVSIVRELHVYGSAVAVHARDTGKLQHQGYGSLLMAEAERIALLEHRSSKIAVISGVGTRHYYRKLGYELEGPYMVKYLSGAKGNTVVGSSPVPAAAAHADGDACQRQCHRVNRRRWTQPVAAVAVAAC